MNLEALSETKTLLFNKGSIMKVLVLASGGDAPGMNRFLWEIYNKLGVNVYFAYAGFTGLINDEIYPLKEVMYRDLRDCAGVVTRSSRCPEFKQEKVFKMGLENAQKFDVVVILGGNGSEKGAKRLFEAGVNTIFVPATIDNDVDDCHYSIGFSTAVKECVYTVENSMPSIDAFVNTCLFEVMGRDDSAICSAVAERVDADYAVLDKGSLDFEKIKNVILKNYIKSKSSCIIVRENLMEIQEIADKLNESLGMNVVKTQIVGRTQRGGKPTAEELFMAKKFAKETIRCIKTKVFGVRILANEENDIVVKEFK